MVSSGQSESERARRFSLFSEGKPTPFLAIFEADLESTVKSKLFIGWLIIVLFLGSLIALGNSQNEAKASIGGNLSLFIYLWSLVVIGLSAGAVSSEADMVADSVLSKSVKRYEYILAKVCARLFIVLISYFLCMIALSAMALRVSPVGTLEYGGWLAGVLMVGLVLAALTIMGVMFSTLAPNTVVSFIFVLVIWYGMLVGLSIASMNALSPGYVSLKMPDIMAGYWDATLSYMAAAFSGLAAAFTLIAVYYFGQKDMGGK